MLVLKACRVKHDAQRARLCAGRVFYPTARPGRNFLVHGQNTNARSELQLLKRHILSPGWRKAHVVRRQAEFTQVL